MKFFSNNIQKLKASSDFYEKIYNYQLALLAIIAFWCLFYYSYTNIFVGDEREHIYASFLVYQGKSPYKDFFEHHHPLLWYTFYPFMTIFNNSPNIWYAARSYALILLIINSAVLIKLGHEFISARYGILAAVLSICPHCVFIAQTEFRPDALMMTTFLCGLYFYLIYIKYKKNAYLYQSFILFLLSLFALQKACIQIIPLGVLTGYLIYKKEIPYKTFFKALIMPFIMVIIYLIYLYQSHALKDYFELNWLLNLKINFNIQYKINTTLYYNIANALAIMILITNKPKFLKYLAFLCVSTSLALQYAFESPFIQYWLPIYPYFALITAYYTEKLLPHLRIFAISIIIIAITHNDISYIKAIQTYPKLNLTNKLISQEINLSKKDDLVLGNLETLGGLRTDAAGYYWFGRDYIAQLDIHYFKRHKLPDINKILKDEKPKLVSGRDEISCITNDFQYTNACKVISSYDRKFLETHYLNTGYFYVRKN